MPIPSPLRRAGAGLLLSTALLTLTACLPAPGSSPPAETTSEPPAVTQPSPDSRSEEALRTYYESLLADMRQALLDEKQADYITRRDYESRISELESKLDSLRGEDHEPTAGEDIPVSGNPTPNQSPSTAAPADTSPVPAETQAPTTAFHYRIEDGRVVITAYQGTARDVIIPAEIAGFPVVRIGDNAFQSTKITSVTLPDTVTSIGWFAFAECDALHTVTLPASVISIDYGAFDACPALTILCPKDSYAAQYAASFALKCAYTE